MTKPEDIPQDVWHAANVLVACINIDAPSRLDQMGHACRAIMAAKAEEREKAALIAESYDGAGLAGTYGMELGDASRTMYDIANAIRNRDTV